MVPVAGKIYYADLPYAENLQSGRRPVIVVQNEKGNKYGPLVHVVPLTTKIRKLHMATHVLLKPSEENGLDHVSMTLAENLRPIPKELLREPIGTLNKDEHEVVKQAVRAHLAV